MLSSRQFWQLRLLAGTSREHNIFRYAKLLGTTFFRQHYHCCCVAHHTNYGPVVQISEAGLDCFSIVDVFLHLRRQVAGQLSMPQSTRGDGALFAGRSKLKIRIEGLSLSYQLGSLMTSKSAFTRCEVNRLVHIMHIVAEFE